MWLMKSFSNGQVAATRVFVGVVVSCQHSELWLFLANGRVISLQRTNDAEYNVVDFHKVLCETASLHRRSELRYSEGIRFTD